MIAVLCKDLRLAWDAMRPWCLTVIGVVVALSIAALLPQFRSFAPPMGGSGVESGVSTIANVLLPVFSLSAVPVALFLVASIALGDDRRGAGALAATQPERRRLSPVSAAIVAFLATLAPVLLVVVCARIGRPLWHPVWRDVPLELAVALTAPAVAGLAFAVRSTRLRIGSLVLALLAAAVCAAIAGGFLAIASMPFVVPDVHAAVDRVNAAPQHEIPALIWWAQDVERTIRAVELATFGGGAFIAAIAIGAVGWMIGLVRRISAAADRVWFRRALWCGGVVVAIIAASVAGARSSLSSAAILRLPGAAKILAHRADTSERLEWLELDRYGATGRTMFGTREELDRIEIAPRVVDVLLAEIGRKPHEERMRDPVLVRLRELRANDEQSALWWVASRTPIWDEEALGIAVEAFLEQPGRLDSGYMLGWLGVVPQDVAFAALSGSPDSEARREHRTRLAEQALPVLEAIADGASFEEVPTVAAWRRQRGEPLDVPIPDRTREAIRAALPEFRAIAAGNASPAGERRTP
jgi:hypothetical protein